MLRGIFLHSEGRHDSSTHRKPHPTDAPGRPGPHDLAN